ncbi:MAG: DUF423 domain-containing protein [Burkholderiaceae bacterium]
MRTHIIVAIASLLLMLGVGTGAFGAHGLKAHVGVDMLAVWHTAVLYQFVHALGLLAIAALRPLLHQRLSTAAALFLLAGILIFSGSLYALVLSGVGVLGAITPIGGVCFMIGWLLLTLAALRGGRPTTGN